ncbi:DnaJ-class molecular chaperone [Salinibacter ruber]|uniref:hypothetical protein n=1 Tax=Salinibacter ruber TaxID=146919 RepID=UPI00216742BC|nr:hypothetical protein [Salinibacter ruber]MCS3651910.1 DnaJ-class molecular chaperone [Salinibacter ruber]MCS3655101.1 DnaJ-class molecular chaperone [Salinibacter ruber]
MAVCPKCDGTGHEKCYRCRGKGEVEKLSEDGTATGEMKDCVECGGTGNVRCDNCGGSGGTNTWDEVGMDRDDYEDNVL